MLYLPPSQPASTPRTTGQAGRLVRFLAGVYNGYDIPSIWLAQGELTDHHAAIVALSQHLETMGGEDATVVAARSRQVLSGAQSQMGRSG